MHEVTVGLVKIWPKPSEAKIHTQKIKLQMIANECAKQLCRIITSNHFQRNPTLQIQEGREKRALMLFALFLAAWPKQSPSTAEKEALVFFHAKFGGVRQDCRRQQSPNSADSRHDTSLRANDWLYPSSLSPCVICVQSLYLQSDKAGQGRGERGRRPRRSYGTFCPICQDWAKQKACLVVIGWTAELRGHTMNKWSNFEFQIICCKL